jgi:hypothetical protein
MSNSLLEQASYPFSGSSQTLVQGFIWVHSTYIVIFAYSSVRSPTCQCSKGENFVCIPTVPRLVQPEWCPRYSVHIRWMDGCGGEWMDTWPCCISLDLSQKAEKRCCISLLIAQKWTNVDCYQVIRKLFLPAATQLYNSNTHSFFQHVFIELLVTILWPKNTNIIVSKAVSLS